MSKKFFVVFDRVLEWAGWMLFTSMLGHFKITLFTCSNDNDLGSIKI